MKQLDPTMVSNGVLEEAYLLCWLLSGEMNTALQEDVCDRKLLSVLSDMLQSVTNMMIGQGHPPSLVAAELSRSLDKLDNHRIQICLGDAVSRFLQGIDEAKAKPEAVVVADISVSLAEKECLNAKRA